MNAFVPCRVRLAKCVLFLEGLCMSREAAMREDALYSPPVWWVGKQERACPAKRIGPDAAVASEGERHEENRAGATRGRGAELLQPNIEAGRRAAAAAARPPPTEGRGEE